MSNGMLIAAVIAVIASGALAIAGIERNVPLLTVVFKPLATLLLLAVVGWPATSFARLVWVGILLSLVGDIALLSNSDQAFAVGLGAFLAAHVTYIVANLGVATWSPRVVVVAVVVVGASVVLLRFARPQIAVLRVATIVYGAAISTMVVTAWAMLGGPLDWAAFGAAGAVLFYVSDSSLALNRFYRPIPHVAYLALGVYWLGQIGIALAARGPMHG
jgi:alkenylglycerophosphocholine/alkenylglycerophosphoethanolamine hydrolase